MSLIQKAIAELEESRKRLIKNAPKLNQKIINQVTQEMKNDLINLICLNEAQYN